MEAIYNILSSWSSAIVTAFEQHLFISAIFTLLAVSVFIYLEKKQKKTVAHVVQLLIAWLIVVPIIGTLLDGLGWLLSMTKKVFNLFVATYNHFESQPLLVLGYLLTSIILYFAWPKFQKNHKPIFRTSGSIALFLILTFLTVPIVNQFTNDTEPNKLERPIKNPQADSSS